MLFGGVIHVGPRNYVPDEVDIEQIHSQLLAWQVSNVVFLCVKFVLNRAYVWWWCCWDWRCDAAAARSWYNSSSCRRRLATLSRLYSSAFSFFHW